MSWARVEREPLAPPANYIRVFKVNCTFRSLVSMSSSHLPVTSLNSKLIIQSLISLVSMSSPSGEIAGSKFGTVSMHVDSLFIHALGLPGFQWVAFIKKNLKS